MRLRSADDSQEQKVVPLPRELQTASGWGLEVKHNAKLQSL